MAEDEWGGEWTREKLELPALHDRRGPKKYPGPRFRTRPAPVLEGACRDVEGTS